MLVLGNSLFHRVLVLRLLYVPEVVVLKFSYMSVSPGGLVKMDSWAPPSEFLF